MLPYIYKIIGELFPLNNEYLKYIIPILAIIISIPLYLLLKVILVSIIKRYVSNRRKIENDIFKKLFEPFQKRFLFIFFIFLIYFIVNPLLKDSKIKIYFGHLISILFVFSLAQIIIAIIDLILKTRFFESIDKTTTKKTIKTFTIISKVLIWFIALLISLNIFGIKISNLLAGLGIGGVIIALATQNIFQDIFSYLTILMDKPFDVGDFVSFDNLSGTVEFIGIKSTRIRILDGELLIIPNNILVGSKLRNFRNIEKRRAFIQLKLSIDTKVEKIEKLRNLIIKTVLNHKETQVERSFITTIDKMAIILDTYYYVVSDSFEEFLRIKHEINLEILKIIQKEKVRLISDIQTINIYDEKKN
ncbi:MAG: mechanosensitive ion channel family protein [Exilispira sp.]